MPRYFNLLCLVLLISSAASGQLRLADSNGRIITFGTAIDPEFLVKTPQTAAATAQRHSPIWRSKGDQLRKYLLNEYPVSRSDMFLTGHSMGTGSTFYPGAKYNLYWKVLAPMSGPFADDELYPWDRIKQMPLFISEGTRATASLASSRKMTEWLKTEKFNVLYKEVEGDHGAMVPMILPDVFRFFSEHK